MASDKRVKFSLLLGSTLLTLLSLEGVARVARALRGGGKEAQEPKVYMEYDPLLGWRKIPGASVTYRRREFTVKATINQLGLRDPERGYQAPRGTERILALGDSYVEGHGVEMEDTVSQVLERSLRERGCAAEVVNGGTSGYSSDQEYLFYTSEGVKYAPQIVLIFFFNNDIVYNDLQDWYGWPKPIFEQRMEGLTLHRFPVKRLPSMPPPPDEKARSGSRSALYEWLRDRLWYGNPAAYNALARLDLWPPMPRLSIRLELRVYQSRTPDPIEEAWSKTGAILEALRRDATQNGSRFLCVYVPSAMEVDDRAWELTRTRYDMREPEWNRGLVLSRLQEIGREKDFPVLDLTEALRQVNHGLWGHAYYPIDGHWTRRGHRAAANAVLSYLDQERWLSCGSQLHAPN